ncbi:hypothetical protein E3N88_15479 [Mikania micrantha]|uniref:Uncharacterized protein n=1 Tax=Mikania micrantha TaxID=192012 RepID=A0A5N6NVQ3_9ASTR|nr:hypothetical protein E3N88_15479 [Mikania micrantha]
MMFYSRETGKNGPRTTNRLIGLAKWDRRMDNNEDTSRNWGRRPATDDLTIESRRRKQAFAAHVACTRREIWRSGKLSNEVRVLREKNDRLERRNDRLEERNSRLEEQVETLRLQVSQLMSQHGQMVDIMQEHDGRITENRVANEETQAMVQASDAMLNAWAAPFIEEPPQEDGPEFEVNDLGEKDFDEDPNEDPEEDDDDGDAASDILHVSMDSD